MVDIVLTKKSDGTARDEHALHEVRAYNALNKVAFQRVVTPGSMAESIGLDLYKSDKVSRIVIRCMFPIWPETWLIKNIMCGHKVARLTEGLEIDSYRLIYYGADDFPAEIIELDEQPTREVIRNYFRKHRHCSYAVILAYNIPADGEGAIVDSMENPNFRVKKTIAALNDTSSRAEVQAYINTGFAENAVKLMREYQIESSITSARNLAARSMWGIEPPQLSSSIKDILGKKGAASSKTTDPKRK